VKKIRYNFSACSIFRNYSLRWDAFNLLKKKKKKRKKDAFNFFFDR